MADTQDLEQKREELIKQAWQRWWHEDFSWAGLARKAVDGPVEAYGGGTIQDYWRRDPETGRMRTDEEMREAGELIACGDTEFHIVHLPSRLPSGEETWKADLKAEQWCQLERVLSGRFKVAERQGAQGLFLSPPSFLKGAVLWRGIGSVLKRHEKVHVDFTGAIFLEKVDFRNVTFSLISVFDHACFAEDADFSMCVFECNSNFDNCLFLGGAAFTNVEYAEGADFNMATFIGRAHFELSRFAQNADFYSSRFLSGVQFWGATFSNSVRFERAKFFHFVNFHGVLFKGHSDFREICCEGGVEFIDAKFAASVKVTNARFRGWVSFCDVHFQREAGFAGTTFDCPVEFSACQFEGVANFYDTSFLFEVRFTGSVFESQASFKGVVWPAFHSHWSAAFNHARFRLPPDFNGCKWPDGQTGLALAAFDGAVLDGGIRFTFHDIDPDRRFACQLASALDVKEDGETRLEKSSAKDVKNSRLAQLERGCRVLKQAMEKASNKIAEQQFHRFELKARRAQSSTPLTERFFSWLYEKTANYGASLGRPVVCLFGVWFVFLLIFWLFAHGIDQSLLNAMTLRWGAELDPVLLNAAEFSASRVLPFGAFEDVSKKWIAAYNCAHSPACVLLIRLLASLESVLALSLVFVFGVALRRKFQIN